MNGLFDKGGFLRHRKAGHAAGICPRLCKGHTTHRVTDAGFF
jgi:hypothetical protein